MNVFVLHGEDELAFADFLGNLREAAADVGGVGIADDALAGKHHGVRLGILNVKRAHTLFERDRGVEVFNKLVGGQVKAAAAALAVLVGHGFALIGFGKTKKECLTIPSYVLTLY